MRKHRFRHKILQFILHLNFIRGLPVQKVVMKACSFNKEHVYQVSRRDIKGQSA